MKYRLVGILVGISLALGFVPPAQAAPQEEQTTFEVQAVKTCGYLPNAPVEDRELTVDEQAKLDQVAAALAAMNQMSDEELQDIAKSLSSTGEISPQGWFPAPPWVKIVECIASIALTVWAGVNAGNIIPVMAGVLLNCVGLPNIMGASKFLAHILWNNRERLAAIFAAWGWVGMQMSIKNAPYPG